MKKFAVIFDMDGVIVDSNPAHKEAINEFCKQYNIILDEEKFRKHVNGRQNRDWIPAVFGSEMSSDRVLKLADEKERLFRKVYESTIKPLSGLKNFLMHLDANNIPRAIATSAPVENVRFTLERTDLQKYFKIILDDRNVSKGKPHPDIYIKTVEALNLSADKCIVFEDSLAGVEAAKGAGCKVVGVLTTHSREELRHTDLTIKDFSEINLEDLEKWIQ